MADYGLLYGLAGGVGGFNQANQDQKAIARQQAQQQYQNRAQNMGLIGQAIAQGGTAYGQQVAKYMGVDLGDQNQAPPQPGQEQPQQSGDQSSNGFQIPQGMLSGRDMGLLQEANKFNTDKEADTGRHATPNYKTHMLEFTQGDVTDPAKAADLLDKATGSRSPVNTLGEQYDNHPTVKLANGSQVAMQQMLDSYRHPSPQGDASLFLNAFKIKFPNVPDVNSLEELKSSQAAPDQWRQKATQVLSGGLDQATRDNLMRDGVSTFRGNVQSVRGIQKKFQSMAKSRKINDTSFTAEPAIDQTFKDAQALNDQIGDYVPPSGRGGIEGKVMGLLGGRNGKTIATPQISPTDRKALMDHLVQSPNDPRKAEIMKLLQGE